MPAHTPFELRPRVSIEHIALDERGNARLAGHRIKVKHIVALMQAHSYTAEQIQAEVYPHLSLSQVYAALAYYHDHKAEIDKRIEEDTRFAERERQKQLSDPRYQELVAKMKARWSALKTQEESPSSSTENAP